jgi:Fanconi anemia group M protein
MNPTISITIDHREKPSHVPELLEAEGSGISFSTLEAGDYLVNNEVLIERKTAGDFVQSILSGRLFGQCSKLRKTPYVCLIIIEGSLSDDRLNTSLEAIQGALLSVMTRWQIPVYLASDKHETTSAIIRIGKQNFKGHDIQLPKQTGARKSYGSQVFFLQGLSSVGPQLAQRLLKQFGSIAKIANASAKELQSVEGIGKRKASMLSDFFRREVYSIKG